jgi:integrase/recombinase XerD
MAYTEIEQAIKLLQSVVNTNVEPNPLAQVVQAYTEAKTLVLSPHTMLDYGLTFRRFLEFVPAERPIHEIDQKEIRDFLNTIPGGKKNKQNARVALGALWSFAVSEGYANNHVVRKVEIAKPETRAIIPFSREEVARLLAAARDSGRDNLRNVAIVKTLLDTGVRASELCGLKFEDLEGDYIRVLGKGSKERRVPISALAMSAVVEYMGARPPGKRTAPVFLSEHGRPLNRDSLRLLINRLALRGKVNNAHPHKFRHTFALNYILNGGDPYSLQMILGHSTMDMVKRYLYLTNRDVSAVHNRASPLKNWGLD